MPAGPMKMQPADRSATMPVPLLPLGTPANDVGQARTTLPKAKRTRTDELRAAKARTTRLNSLRKQRQAQKADAD